jgi:hydrogenase/urease accessory protein HupE
MSRCLRAAWLALSAVALSCAAEAHQSSDSFLRLDAQGEAITGRWDIALRDLDQVLALDGNADGRLSWGEVRTSAADIIRYASGALTINGGGASPSVCALHWPASLQLDRHNDGTYVVLQFTGRCTAPISVLQPHYTLFAEADSGHRGLLSVTLGSQAFTAVAGPAAPAPLFTRQTGGGWRSLAQYFRTGVEHIWTGYDHILFLLSLLLPAVLARGMRASFFEVCKVVTAFTVAHSLTLALAALGVVRLPARLSESAIALSVLLAALNNVYPLVRERRWLVAYAFGLIHGFGFANVLDDLSLPPDLLTLALFGFNLGVEAGQMTIVAVFLPLAFLLRETRFYRRGLLAGGSCAIALIAALWLVERALDFKLPLLP